LDGGFEAKGQMYLLLLPADADKKPPKDKAQIETMFPEKATGKPADVILYTNGMAHVRVQRKGEALTLPLASLPEKFKKVVLTMHFPSDMIVPQGFVLPRSMSPLITEVPTIGLLDDAIVMSPEFGQKAKVVPRSQYKGSGSVFLTSITAGSITMLDGKSLAKVAEFPTEGTPCGMELVNGQLYIVDQAKSRILILDPAGRKFAGQIDLLAKSAPKSIAAPQNGKWVYVSESAASDIAVVELDSGKVLMRTKVRPGPGRIALTPDGVFLVILNVTSGEVSIMSTYNQKVVSTLKVGDMPSALAISSDSKRAYVSNRMSNTVSVIDIPTRKLVANLKVGVAPTAVALSPDNSKLYVASGRENTVTAYDTKTNAPVGEAHLPMDIEFPGSLCIMPTGKKLIVCSQQGQAMGVIDTEKMELERSENLGHAAHDAAWVPAP
jgi:YVTN family beta-propeller protein